MRPAWLVEQERQQAAAAATAVAVAVKAVPESVELRDLEKQDSAKGKVGGTENRDKAQENGQGLDQAEDEDQDQDQDQDEMMRMLGFSAFSTTSGQHVASNDGSARGAVSKNQQRKYRQYMNRLGGFNRKLDKI
jgi:U4/U6.U5 tri-snRNP-associated protein 3